MAIYKRSRIWQMLEETTTFIIEVFKREGKEVFEPTMEKFNRPKDGWVNRVWETPEARRCHLDVVDARETKGLDMFHCCVFPNLTHPGPIYGLDVIAGAKKVTGFFHDFSPLAKKDHSMVDWFVNEAKNYEPSKVRELPDWAMKIFSPGMVAASNITTEKELNAALSLAQCNLGAYFTLLRREKTKGDIEEIKDAQNRYAKHQRENPHTPRVMKSLGLPEADVKEFCTNALFPYIE